MRNVVTAISVTEQSKSKVGEAPRALKLLGSTGTHAHRRSGGVYPLNDRLYDLLSILFYLVESNFFFMSGLILYFFDAAQWL